VLNEPSHLAAAAGLFEVDPANDTEDERRGIGDSQQILGLVQRRRGLHKDGAVETASAQVRQKIGRPVRPANRQRRVKPAVVATGRIPEMLMCIDP